MKEDKFVDKNIAKWKALEDYNNILLKRGIGGLKKHEIQEFTELYRISSHHLAYGRTHFPQSNINVYLNQIISVSHNYIFVPEKSFLPDTKRYFLRGFPEAVRENFRYVAAAFAAFFAGAVLIAIAVVLERSYGEIFFEGVSASGLNLDPADGQSALAPLMGSFIITNNIRVCLLSFAAGAAAGVGTLYVLFYNGLIVGALSGIVIADGANFFKFLAMILPHGFIELPAIFISGAAGLMIGKAMLVPGDYKRKDAVVMAGKKAAYLIPGIAAMLVVAGIIEGFFTPLAISYIFKLAFAVLTLVLMVLYFQPRKASRAPSE